MGQTVKPIARRRKLVLMSEESTGGRVLHTGMLFGLQWPAERDTALGLVGVGESVVALRWPTQSMGPRAAAADRQARVQCPTGGFFFHGMSGTLMGALGALGWAILSSSSTSAAVAPGLSMFPRQEAMRAWRP
jgi:hypothetical protein